MVLKSLVFALMAYGIAMIIALLVSLMIKSIALIVQRGGKNDAANSAQQKS